MSSLGVGVVDTSSLWASASLIFKVDAPPSGDQGTDIFQHPNRALYDTKPAYFESFLHNLILYDELRTDLDILPLEYDWYREPVSQLLEVLNSTVRIQKLPQTFSDQDIIERIAPTFIRKTRDEFRGGNPSAGTAQIAIAAAGYGHSRPLGLLGRTDGIVDNLSDSVAEALLELVDEGLGSAFDRVSTSQGRYLGLVRNLSILARTVRYAAHSRHVHSSEKRPSAFCASPRRIELLKDYLDAKALSTLQPDTTAYSDLFAMLGLPSSGYDFASFNDNIKPLSLSDLTRYVSGLAPKTALERVLELREKPAAKQLREIWAQRLWNGGAHALEGNSINASMTNINAGGNVTQVIIALDRSTGALANADIKALSESDLKSLLRAIKAELAN